MNSKKMDSFLFVSLWNFLVEKCEDLCFQLKESRNDNRNFHYSNDDNLDGQSLQMFDLEVAI